MYSTQVKGKNKTNFSFTVVSKKYRKQNKGKNQLKSIKIQKF